MDRDGLLQALRRRWWVVVMLAVLGLTLGALPEPATSVDVVTRWNASHTLLLSNTSSTQSIYSDPILFNQLQLFATTGVVPARAAEVVGYSGVPAALAAQVSVAADQGSGALRISTSQDSADRSVAVADAFADELARYLSERQDSLRQDRLAASLERLDTLIADIDSVQAELRTQPGDVVLQSELDALTRQHSVAFEQFNVLQVDQGQLVLTTQERAQAVATTERGLSAPRSRTSRGIFGGLVGLGAGLGAVVLLARIDRKLRTRAQVEVATGMAVRVAIPHRGSDSNSEVVVSPDRHDSLSDSYRRLRSVVSFVDDNDDRDNSNGNDVAPRAGPPVVLVVSPGSGDGKTSVSSNLAVAFVESGATTLAVNTDFRRPALSERILGYKREPSSFALHEIASLPREWLVQDTGLDGLGLVDLAGVAHASPGDLARATAKLLPELAKGADVVVIDSSPIGVTAEVLELVPLADVIVVVVRIDHTSISLAERSVAMLRALSKGQFVLVTIGETSERTGYYYEYSSRNEPGKRRRPSLRR